ncbi:MAG: translation initiation factor IF-2 [Endomicrobium sp.]|jgi:translation initiation factor IF-2|nr:translation initiation factor IF-2 [Endomicrobium sp.]
MSLKQINKMKDSEKKIIKKKSLSGAKRKSKKVTISVTKKRTKAKSVTGKANVKVKTKSVKVKAKVKKSYSPKNESIKKSVSRRKKILKTDNEKNVVEKYDSESFVKKEKLKEISVVAKLQRIPIVKDDLFLSSSTLLIEEQKSKLLADQELVGLEQSVKKQEEQGVTQKKSTEFKSETNKSKYIETILINELITVKELADKMKLKAGDVLKKLLSLGSLATINQRLDTDIAILLAGEFGYDAKLASIYSEEKKINAGKEDLSKLKSRPPVVTIMGHVNHGKTSLLDTIRSSNVVASEYGGITQHIGAYKVKGPNGKDVVFLDTPGHEIFTAMRSRGTQVTDIVVLVVSASDGVMPQTVEVINLSKAANVPVIVAINKIDLPVSDSQRIRKDLSNYGLVPEEWGGDTIMIDISAKQKINIDLLLEMILLKAEMMELKANPSKDAKGVVIEAKLDSRKGTVVTLLVQDGTLKIGDNLVIGTTYGKVRAMSDEHGKRLTGVSPSTPVEILGVNKPPQVGDEFVVVGHESQARQIVQLRKEKIKEISLKPRHHLSLADINLRQAKDLRVILKADVQGSLGALVDALERLSTPEISLKIIHKGAGAITESDVTLAVASDALIIGFNLRPDVAVEKLIEIERVSMNVYRVIYDLIADVKAAMEGLLDPYIKEKVLGKAIVRQVFKLSSYGTILGCFVIDGKIQRGTRVRVLRDNIIIFEGNISSLKRFKDDIKEVEKGYECGIGLENFSDVKQGDIIENYTIEKVTRKLDDN